MCGRYASYRSDAELARQFSVGEIVGDEQDPSWNIAPEAHIRVVLDRADTGDGADDGPGGELHRARWGLVPGGAKDLKVGRRMFNARSETVLDKPVFRKAALQRRLVVPMDGYFEWQAHPGGGPKTRTTCTRTTSCWPRRACTRVKSRVVV